MIEIHTSQDFEKMRCAGQAAAEVLDFITPYVRIGVTTNELNDLCHKFITQEQHAIPAPLNYNGFPKSICTSKNNVVCHGIPDDIPLKNGDILNIDVTVIVDGWHGDTSRMYWVGEPSIKAKKLCEVTYHAMLRGIEQAYPGNPLSAIGRAIENYVHQHAYSVVRDFCGHGIGKKFHTQPNVLHFYHEDNDAIILKEGMFFTIEPMINAGKAGVIVSKKDNWTAKTRDMSLSTQFEHTLGITKDGPEIFTLSRKKLDQPPYY